MIGYKMQLGLYRKDNGDVIGKNSLRKGKDGTKVMEVTVGLVQSYPLCKTKPTVSLPDFCPI